ncbi:MAG: lysophospholipid acyltransferase family protein [bacterium]|nr:lysophospholipid acyltransferase family protein [bacterium]MDD5354696.1 lysophospholipid acyltransferase family protein [bacterium]
MMYWIYLLLSFLARHCPPGCLSGLSRVLGYGTYLFNRQQRTNVLANLEHILPPGTSVSARKEKARAVFINFYTYLFEFFALKSLDRDQAKTLMAPDTVDLFNRFARDKQPFIIVSAHLGNWEVAAFVMDALGCINNLIYQPHADKRINALFINNRNYRQTRLVALGMGLKNAFKGLKNGEILTMVGDWGIGDSTGIEVLFFGRLTRFPCGPAEIAVKTGVPIVPGFTIRQGKNKFAMGCTEPLVWDKQASADEQIKSITQSFAATLEKQVCSYPEQWLIFKRIWEN